MKRISAFLSLILLMLSLASCTLPDIGTAEKIVSPVNNLIPISGEWKIVEYKQGYSDSLTDDEIKSWIGRAAIFDEEIAAVGDDSFSSPVYKIKNVSSSDYLLYQYKISPDYLGITAANVQVATVSSDGRFHYEFIMTGDSRIVASIDGTFFYFDRTSGSVSEASKGKYADSSINNTQLNRPEDSTTQMSGVLLGLRSAKNQDSGGSVWEYRTIYIPSENGIPGNIYEMKNLFVPRQSGFWILGVKRNTSGETVRETLYAYPSDRGPALSESPEISVYGEDVSISILYAGNDYVSTEYSSKSPDAHVKSMFQVLSLDNMENSIALKISDIAGEGGKFALNDGAAKYISSNASNNRDFLSSLSEENFAISRRNGHWIMKGRLYPSSNDSYIDFNIKAIPPSKLVSYDELCLPWNLIKSRVPEAVDAFTSPGRDMAVIITGNSILVYSIENNTLSDSPLKKLQLKDKESIVMAEWAQGKYVDRWEKDFTKNGGYALEK